MKDWFKYIAIVIFYMAIIVGGIALKISVWHECRTDHSFLYCLQLTGGR